MKVGLNEAARLAGKDQSTITRACQSGRLSFTKDEHGNRMFDPAELERVYGPLRPPEGPAAPPPTDALAEALERAHVAEVAGLQREVRRLEEHVRLLETQCSQWQAQAGQITRLLTDQRERTLAQRLRLVFSGKAA
jgi:hypothetical protein